VEGYILVFSVRSFEMFFAIMYP